MINVVKIKTTVINIISHSDNIFTIELKSEKRIPRYEPGQFLHLALDEYDICGGFWPDSRVFSIASSCEQDTITLVYSVKGSFTSRMCNELVVGKQLWIKLPFGCFTIEKTSQEDLVLIAGGTGIAPYIPYLQSELREPSGRKILFVYGVRKPEHLLFDSVLSESLARLPNFDLIIFNESGKMIPGPLFEKISSIKGLVDVQLVFEKSCALRNPLYFISGPPGMIQNVKQALSDQHVENDRIKIDDW
jgi:ferredoxin-NADP reductase